MLHEIYMEENLNKISIQQNVIQDNGHQILDFRPSFAIFQSKSSFGMYIMGSGQKKLLQGCNEMKL